MTFDDWLLLKKMTNAEAARLLGINRSTIGRYRNGLRVPRGEIINRITEVTNGAVMPNDWFPTSAAAQ